MAVGDDFVGRACPLCGALDSLETDESRGEVACTQCAKVVALGLEESIATRYNADATYDDVDRHTSSAHAEGAGALNASRTLSRTAAASLAAGQSSRHEVSRTANCTSDVNRLSHYSRTPLHPRMRQYMENLVRIARRGAAMQTLSLSSHNSSSSSGNAVLERALEIARIYVGRRRERRERLEHQNDVAAGCVMIAAEMHQQPIPLSELFVLDASVKKVQEMRALVVREAMLEQEERQLQFVFAANLLRYYLRLLQMQRSRFEEPCQVMLHILRRIGREDYDWTRLVESDRVALAVLLVCTRKECAPDSNSIDVGSGGNSHSNRPWIANRSSYAGYARDGQRPDLDGSASDEEDAYLGSSNPGSTAHKRNERAEATLIARFTASAHLNPQRVSKLLHVADRHLSEIVPVYRQQLGAMSTHAATVAGSATTTTTTTINRPATDATTRSTPVRMEEVAECVVGVKRERCERP